MKSKLSRETIQSILDDVLDKVPRAEILSRYGLTGAMLSRIESGKWFQEQTAREAKNHTKYPKGFDWCGPCAAVMKMPCHACKTRASANGKRPRYSQKTLYAAMQEDGTCQISREPDPLGFDLKPDEEKARFAMRFGGI